MSRNSIFRSCLFVICGVLAGVLFGLAAVPHGGARIGVKVLKPTHISFAARRPAHLRHRAIRHEQRVAQDVRGQEFIADATMWWDEDGPQGATADAPADVVAAPAAQPPSRNHAGDARKVTDTYAKVDWAGLGTSPQLEVLQQSPPQPSLVLAAATFPGEPAHGYGGMRAHPSVGFDVPPSSYFGAGIGLSAGTLSFDYARLDPSAGESDDELGFTANGLFPFARNFGANVDVGYHNLSNDGLNNWTTGGSLVWQIGDMRLGPSFGFQANRRQDFSSDTYNYGGFVDYFATPNITVSGLAGGFSSSATVGLALSNSTSSDNGYYLGGRLLGYPTSDFALAGSIDYTHFSAFSGSGETDYGVDGEYLFWGDHDQDECDCWWPPTSLYAGYSYTAFSQSNSIHIDTFIVGIRLYTDGNGAGSLVDRQRTGALQPAASFAPLSLRF